MVEDQEEICRVCRSESTPDHPLYYPCKCSGSIRFVHEDCLLEWLSHSKKKYCELCEYPFKFSPIYRSDMPERVPLYVLCRQLIRRTINLLKTCIRFLCVILVWLVLLPTFTLRTWRFYFWSGENIGFNNNYHDVNSNNNYNSIEDFDNDNNGLTLKDLLYECLEGQIITAFVVVIFVAAYLFREWMMQNLPDMDLEQEQEQEQEQEEDIDIDAEEARFQVEEDVIIDDINLQHNQFNQEQIALDTLTNAFQVLDLQQQQQQQQQQQRRRSMDNDGDDINDNIRNQLQVLMNDLEYEKERSIHNHNRNLHPNNHYQEERPNSSSFTATSRPNVPYDEDLLFGGPDGTGIYNKTVFNDNKNDEDDDDRFMDKYNQHYKSQNEGDINMNTSSQPSWNQKHTNIHHRHHHHQQDEEEDLILQNDIRKRRRIDRLLESESDTSAAYGTNNYAREKNYHQQQQQQQQQQQNEYQNRPLFPQPPPSPLEPPITPPTPNTPSTPPYHQPIIHAPAIDNVPVDGINENDAPVNDNANNFIHLDNEAEEGLEEDDDEPFDGADDINGILEAIGMRGNPWMLLQNSVLMALMISLCLGISIWSPYVLGRLVIMLRPASLIETPIYIMRLVTDPLVDFILDKCILHIWTLFGKYINSILPEPIQSALYAAQTKLSQSLQNSALSSSIMMTVATMSSGKSVKTNASDTVVSSSSSSLISSPTSSSYTSSSSSLSSFSFYLLSDWSNLEKKMDEWSTLVLTRWHQFASGRTALDRTMCILIGYLLLISLGSWYLSQMKKRHRYSPDASFFQDLLRQQGIFLKVLFFFVIEMLIFPTACGFLLDMTTLPLFSSASLESRYAFQLKNPISSFFLHWFLGTGVLFYFANFISVCREIIRPGVLWYIRDPNDPQFHPIQEMVDKPFSTLLQKIGYSALAYSFMLIFGVGTVTYTLALTNIVFPLRLSFNNPLCSTVAIDFLAVQYLLPPLIMLVKPREYSKKALDWWWHFVCRQLRLTSYMFNVRMADEEGHHVRHTLKAWLLLEKATPIVNDDNVLDIQQQRRYNRNNYNNNISGSPVIFQPDGMLVRVPKYDSVVVDPTRRMLVPVDPVHFQPIDEFERGRKHPAAADTNDEEQSTIVVYIPPYFNQRVAVFLVLLWFSISVFVCSLTVIPLLFGRFLFSHYFAPNAKVNDLYSFTLGLYILVAFVFTLCRTYQLKANGTHLNQFIAKMKKVTKLLYLVSTLGLVMPLVFGIAVDLFVLMPIRSSESKNGLVINLSQDWSFGVAYISIIYNIIHVLPTPNRLQRHLNEITSNGITQADSWAITLNIAAPVILGSIIAIIIPAIISWGVLHFLGSTSEPSMQLSVIKYTYPVTFSVFMVFLAAAIIKKLLNMWMQTVRDDTYLIGKKLHNNSHSQDISI